MSIPMNIAHADISFKLSKRFQVFVCNIILCDSYEVKSMCWVQIGLQLVHITLILSHHHHLTLKKWIPCLFNQGVANEQRQRNNYQYFGSHVLILLT